MTDMISRQTALDALTKYGETYEVSHIDTDDDFYCGYAERRTE